ncbi:MAG: DUF484 family protein [Zoogloea sp.]|nr:DUF484 family protein [Zoogloea sp.]
MNAADVVLYLQDHPDFFDDNADLLPHMTVTHPHTGKTISLTERQLLAMRERIAQIEGKFAELMSYGEENDSIGEKVHRLTLSLLTATDFEMVREAIYSHLRDDFQVPHVAMRIWNCVLTREGREFHPVSEETRFFVGDLAQPYCGPTRSDEISSWFGEAADKVRSVALVPLTREAQGFGLLALGSEDPQRFFPEMGTLYVERIGELVSCALRGQLG